MKPKIQEIRLKKGLLQNYVASQIGMKQQQLSDWENGRAYPRIDKAYKLAKILGVKLTELYEEEQEDCEMKNQETKKVINEMEKSTTVQLEKLKTEINRLEQLQVALEKNWDNRGK